eukprot:1665902-Rhodomonas_salina.2
MVVVERCRRRIASGNRQAIRWCGAQGYACSRSLRRYMDLGSTAFRVEWVSRMSSVQENRYTRRKIGTQTFVPK